jgi:hypothetical protein
MKDTNGTQFTNEALIEAVRGDEHIGVGSGSSIEENFSDQDLIDWIFDLEEPVTPEALIESLVEEEHMFVESFNDTTGKLANRIHEDTPPSASCQFWASPADWVSWGAELLDNEYSEDSLYRVSDLVFMRSQYGMTTRQIARLILSELATEVAL